jgi:ABC-type branched-subunit amino acid transport system ATPase component/MFS family permease
MNLGAKLRERITGGAPLLPLAVLFGLNAVDELDRTAFGVLTPEIRDAFDLSNEGIFSVIAVIGIFALLGGVLIGYFADRLSRVKMAVAGAAVWCVFTLATGLATTVAVLVIVRIMTSIGRAVNDPTHRSLLADYYEPDVRTRVYGAWSGANSAGQFLGPLLGGLLGRAFGWRAPFLVFWMLTAVLVVIAVIKLRDPIRGAHERRAMGASDEAVATEEEAPSLGEAWRILYQVKTLRRIWYSLPFFAISVVGLVPIFAIVYDEVFRLDEFERGLVAAFAEPFQIVGLIVGIPVLTRIALRSPGLILKFTAAAGSVVAGCIALFAFAPNLAVAVLANMLIAVPFALLVPSILSVLSLAIPPRARSLGFSVGALYSLPGLVLLPVVGALADDVGPRSAVLVLIPIFLIGALLLASSSSFVDSDVAKVRASTAAQSEVKAARARGEVKLLLVKDLDVAYGGTQVLFNVNFDVDEGEIVALLGTNGAGKTTLLKTISGLVEADAGAVVFDGRDMTYAQPHEIAARGVVQVPGGKGAFPSLSVAENLRLAGWLYQRDAEYVRAAIDEVLGFFPVLRDRWDQAAGNLSGGEQQMLTLGQAFIAKPRLLMIDELSLGLAPIIVEQLLGIVRAIRDRGTTIILVEQSVNVALTLAETAFFMEKGEIRFRGPTKELLDRPDVLRSVFLEGAGAAVGSTNGSPRVGSGRAAKRRALASNETVLEVRDLRRTFGGITAVDDIGLELRRGQILGIIGPNGAGKTTLFDLISGFLRPDEGRITLDGSDITLMGPEARARLGLGRSFQDARLFPALTVTECVMLALEREVEVRDPVAAALNLPAVADSESKLRTRADELIELMGLDAFANKFISELSTGSRRIVDLACVLAHDPKVLLFDEPSSGIAQRETEALAPLLLRIRDATGASLLVIEHDMPLVTSVSDEMLALDLGRVIARGRPQDVVHDPAVIESYLGTTESVIARSGARASGRRQTKKAKRPARAKAKPKVKRNRPKVKGRS